MRRSGQMLIKILSAAIAEQVTTAYDPEIALHAALAAVPQAGYVGTRGALLQGIHDRLSELSARANESDRVRLLASILVVQAEMTD